VTAASPSQAASEAEQRESHELADGVVGSRSRQPLYSMTAVADSALSTPPPRPAQFSPLMLLLLLLQLT